MRDDGKYIGRCIELAENGLGYVASNPLVGCVIQHDGKIIGEGYHKEFGGPHAEVNAINSVHNTELLKESTLYVNLEPCSHFGKTPPCCDLIIEMGIPRVVIGQIDPFGKVAGQGIKKLKEAGTEVIYSISENDCRYLNRRFLTFHEKKRPYIILKWAQSIDGFIGNDSNSDRDSNPVWITNEKTRILVHKWRSEEQAIMIGTNTALMDNPQLNIRDWTGKDPVRIILDQHLRLPKHLHILDDKIKTIVFTSGKAVNEDSANTENISIDFSGNIIIQICEAIHKKDIQSIFVEGGAQLLQTFISEGIWDEARIFTGKKNMSAGVKAPVIHGRLTREIELSKDKLQFITKD